jgi:hypothetical protein
MPPKKPAFKIKSAVKSEEDADDDMLLSDFQMQRLKQQQEAAAQATKDQLEEKHKAGAVSRSTDVKEEAPKTKEQVDKARTAALNAAGRATTRAAPASIGGGGVSSIGGGRGEDLPANTMDAVLSGYGQEPQPGVFRPIGVRSAMNGVAAERSEEVKNAKVVKDGTAFLQEAAKEQAEVNARNREYFREAETKYGDEIMYVQLPRPTAGHEQQFNLAQMAPGKIGKLLVYKSGKTVLKIGDSACEFNVEGVPSSSGGGGDGGEPEQTTTGFSQYVVAMDSKDVTDRACYQLGWVPRKAVCTPLLEE